MDNRLILVNELETSPAGDDKILSNCPFSENIGIPITLQIADIRDPSSSGSGSFVKPISIPGTKEVNIFFEDVYDVNVSLQYFNPNLKVKAYYYEDSIPVFEGYLQLLKIVVDEVSNSWVYECNIIGEVITLFTKTKNKYVEDIDVSAYDHALTYANITSSWTTPLGAAAVGAGVVYPQVDFGDNNSNLAVMKPEHFRGHLFYRDILRRIFINEGYTWTSTFLDSAFFSRLVFPPREKPALSATAISNNKFLATATGSQTINVPMNANSSTLLVPASQSSNIWTIDFPTEVYDTGNIYNNAGFVFTVPNTAKYNIQGNLGLTFIVTRDTGAGPVNVNANVTPAFQTGLHILVYNSTTATIVGASDLDIQSNTLGAFTTTQYNQGVQLTDIQLTAGHTYYIAIKFANVSVSQNIGSSTGTWAINTTIVSGSNFAAELSSNIPYEGATIEANSLLPLDYKQADFISDLVKTYNLRIMPDKSNPNNLIIEDEPNFYKPLSQARDWFKKHDKGSKVEVLPIGDLDFTKIKARYSEDGDYYNTVYQNEYKEPYGSKEEFITNDFIKGEVTIQPSYAATPYSQNPNTQIVVPTIIKKDNNNISEFKPKMRMLYWSGLITLPVGLSWKFTYNNGANTVVYTQQPHAGHANNPYSPTIDLSFGVPKKVYYYFANQQWTTNNLWNKYFKVDFQRRTDKNSKIIRTKFWLTPDDINIFDFRYPIFTEINGETGYYRVHKIEDYNRGVSETTTVELLKLIDYPAFVPETVEEYNEDNGGGNSNFSKSLNGNFVGGPNNFNQGEYSILQGGENNSIANSSSSVTLLNSENAAVIGVENFVGVGLDEDSEILSDMVNLMDKVKIYSDGHGALGPRVLRVTSDFTVDGTYSIYEIDLDSIGVAITATWDAVAYPVQVTFKIVANTYNIAFYIDDMTSPPSSPPQTIDGNALPYDTGLVTYESITVYSNGTNLNII